MVYLVRVVAVEVVVVAPIVAVAAEVVVAAPIVTVAAACIAVGLSLEEDSPLEVAALIMGRVVDSDLVMSRWSWMIAIMPCPDDAQSRSSMFLICSCVAFVA